MRSGRGVSTVSDELGVCLLCESSLSRWQIETIRRMLAETDASIQVTVVNDSPNRSPGGLVRRVLELREWSIVAVPLTIAKRLGYVRPAKRRVSLDELSFLDEAVRIDCQPDVVDGWKYELPADVVDAASSRADVAILFGFGFVVGPVLSEFEYGVLGFHHGDVREYRGEPMGFWEYVNDEDTAAVTLQRLTDELDAGEIVHLREVSLEDTRLWGGVKGRLFETSKPMLADGIGRIRDDSFTPDMPDQTGDLYTLPRGWPVASYVAKTVRDSVLVCLDRVQSVGSRTG